ncbi:MAG: hypothetical protein KDB02_14545 [Acidimicrobiales bacterium]|nr:hypothetical protein [Acidimicrobiales bacterium]
MGNMARRRLIGPTAALVAVAMFGLVACQPRPRPTRIVAVATVLRSSSDRSFELARSFVAVRRANRSVETSSAALRLDPTSRFQTMEGFGAAITGSTAYNLLSMPARERHRFLVETFSVRRGLGYSYVRVPIGASDFSLSEYTLDDTPGIENFALQYEERELLIPVLREILRINPHLKVMGSPWTAPPWMKVSDVTSRNPHPHYAAGYLDPARYQDYATYFVKWIEAFQANGVPIESITMQNEPLNPWNSVSMLMPWDQQQAFVRDALGPALAAAGLHTKVYAFDHNFNYDGWPSQDDYPIRVYSDPAAARFLTGAAYHDYGGTSEELLDIHAKAPDKGLLFTESSLGLWNDGRNLAARLVPDAIHFGTEMSTRWNQGVIVWNLMLDANGGPNRPGGCRTCFGAVDLGTDGHTITRNSHYIVIGHLASVVRPGAVRIGTTGSAGEGIDSVAFVNRDHSRAVLLVNSTSTDRSTVLLDGNRRLDVVVPARGVLSVRWPGPRHSFETTPTTRN